MQPYQYNNPAPQHYDGPPQHYYNQSGPPPQQIVHQPQYGPPVGAQIEPKRESGFKTPGTFKNTLATAAVGGAGFGAGSALAGGLVNAIF